MSDYFYMHLQGKPVNCAKIFLTRMVKSNFLLIRVSQSCVLLLQSIFLCIRLYSCYWNKEKCPMSERAREKCTFLSTLNMAEVERLRKIFLVNPPIILELCVMSPLTSSYFTFALLNLIKDPFKEKKRVQYLREPIFIIILYWQFPM